MYWIIIRCVNIYWYENYECHVFRCMSRFRFICWYTLGLFPPISYSWPISLSTLIDPSYLEKEGQTFVQIINNNSNLTINLNRFVCVIYCTYIFTMHYYNQITIIIDTIHFSTVCTILCNLMFRVILFLYNSYLYHIVKKHRKNRKNNTNMEPKTSKM